MAVRKREKILEELKYDEFTNITSLSEKLDIPRTTITFYLKKFIDDGLVIKDRGYVKKVRPVKYEEQTKSKFESNSKEKKEIAKRAATYIKDKDIIYIDSGSTTLNLIHYIWDKDIIVYTNNISLLEMVPSKDFKPEVYVIPGSLYKSTSAIVGSLSVHFLNNIFIDKAFVGVNKISGKELFTTNQEEAILKKTILKNATQSYILFEKEKKVNGVGKYKFGTLDSKVKEV